MNPSPAAKRLTHLKERPFAGVLPGQFDTAKVTMILKPMLMSHVLVSPLALARDFGKNVARTKPNPPDLDFYHPDFKESKPIHVPSITSDKNRWVRCQHAGNHGVSLKATKVCSLSMVEINGGYLMAWTDPFDKRRELRLPNEE